MNLTLVYVFGVVYFFLAVCHLCILIFRKNKSDFATRTKSWWLMVTLMLPCLISNSVSILVFAIIAYSAFKEFVAMIPKRDGDRLLYQIASLVILVQFIFVYLNWYQAFVTFIPVYAFILIPAIMIMIGKTEHYMKTIAILMWGLMLTGFGLSHIGFLVQMTKGAELMVFLIFITEFNDVFQYMWGKVVGKHSIIASISPKKTWEGFILGGVTATVLSAIVAPYLTSFSPLRGAGIGLVISIAGFLGDANMSAIKRDFGIKDTGSIFPGIGGVLDRVDSLMFTAPLFYYYVHYWVAN